MTGPGTGNASMQNVNKTTILANTNSVKNFIYKILLLEHVKLVHGRISVSDTKFFGGATLTLNP